MIGYHHRSQYYANRYILLGKICVVCRIHGWLGSWWLSSWSNPYTTLCNYKNLPVERKLPNQFPLDFSISCNKLVCLAIESYHPVLMVKKRNDKSLYCSGGQDTSSMNNLFHENNEVKVKWGRPEILASSLPHMYTCKHTHTLTLHIYKQKRILFVICTFGSTELWPSMLKLVAERPLVCLSCWESE